MPFEHFLKLCTTLRALYSKEIAQAIFESNVGQYYNLGDFRPTKVLQKGSACAKLKLANA